MIMQPATVEVLTPKSLVVTGVTPAALQTAIDAQTNTLNLALRVPRYGGTAGAVMNDSIAVTSALATVTNNVTTYYATVSWQQFVTPTAS